MTVTHLEPYFLDRTICGRRNPKQTTVHPERVTCKLCNATMDRMAITEVSE